jgi:hypothetical protein
VTVVGRRLTTTANPVNVTTFTEATPTADPSVNREYIHKFGLETRRVINLSNAADTGVFGFMYNLAGSNEVNGSQVVQVYGRTPRTVPVNVTTESLDNRLINHNPLRDGVLICLRGQSGQRAEIRISGTGNIISELDTPNAGWCLNA